MVDVDHAVWVDVNKSIAQHLHVACEDYEVDVVTREQLQGGLFSLIPRAARNRNLVGGNSLELRGLTQICVIGNNKRDLAPQLADLMAKQQVGQTMAGLGDEDCHFWTI